MQVVRRWYSEMATEVRTSPVRLVLTVVVVALAAASLSFAVAYSRAVDAAALAFSKRAFGSLQTFVIRPVGQGEDAAGPLAPTTADQSALQRRFGTVATFHGTAVAERRVQWKGASADAYVRGIEPGGSDPRELSRGRRIEKADVDLRRSVCVLGDSLAKALFPAGSDPLGSTVRVGTTPLQVVGVYKADPNGASDLFLEAPLSTVTVRVLGDTRLTGLRADVVEGVSASSVEEKVRNVLRERHGVAKGAKDGLLIYSPRFLIERFRKSSAQVRIASRVAAGVIFVAACGVVLLLTLGSVRQRAGEIALRRAVGARAGAIYGDLLSSAATVALVGGAVGAGLTVLFGKIAPKVGIGPEAFSAWSSFRLDPLSFVSGLLAASVVALIAALLGARRAMGIQPATAVKE